MGDSGSFGIDTETLLTAAKWTVTILVMGFITQFGRKLASYLMGKAAALRKGKKSPPPAGEPPSAPGVAAADLAREKARYKMEKKAAKSREKIEKKKPTG